MNGRGEFVGEDDADGTYGAEREVEKDDGVAECGDEHLRPRTGMRRGVVACGGCCVGLGRIVVVSTRCAGIEAIVAWAVV